MGKLTIVFAVLLAWYCADGLADGAFYAVKIGPPLEYVGGAPLDPSVDIREYRVYEVDTNVLLKGGILPAGSGDIIANIPAPRGGCVDIAATAVSTEGMESAFSESLRACIGTPAAPVIVVGE